ncbi:ankyrin [Fusarium albosuccineum]|uniref:Ankyrin n=1 Tax=Fusarium albosuccineum TaxID=1237068 RepID=A0A8H4L1X1_9HYPO|nr:ankyrin [Fusarium albosuccineum]
MSDRKLIKQRLHSACRSGDQQTLAELFHELGIGPEQPRHPGEIDQSLPEEQQPPTVQELLNSAIKGEQIDMVNHLFSIFPGLSFDQGPLGLAARTNNAQLVEAMCKLDPGAANGSCCHLNVIAYACQGPESAGVVSALLKGGADPNQRPEHALPFSNANYAVTGELPASIFEEFFDHGYRFDDGWAVRAAVSWSRPDVLEVLFRRGGRLPTARFAPKEELIKLAMENKDLDMVDVINRVYPVQPKNRGFFKTIARILHLKS